MDEHCKTKSKGNYDKSRTCMYEYYDWWMDGYVKVSKHCKGYPSLVLERVKEICKDLCGITFPPPP
jgi:hypothetical protein